MMRKPNTMGVKSKPYANAKRGSTTIARRSIGRLGAAVVMCAMLAACGSSGGSVGSTAGSGWDASVQRARAEGRVVVYNTNPGSSDALKAGFSAAYPGIDAEFLSLQSTQMNTRVDAEFGRKIPGYDVLISGDTSWSVAHLATQGFYADVSGPSISALDSSLRLRNGPAIMTLLEPFGFAWNTADVSGTPTFQDMLKPQYRGKVGIYDWHGANNHIYLYKQLEDEMGIETLKALASQKPRFYPGLTQLAQALGAGEVDFADFMIKTALQPPSLPTKIAYTKKPVASPLWTSVSGRAPHPSAAQVFVNWLLSPKGQEVAAAGKIAVMPGVATAVGTSADVQVADESKYSQSFYDDYSKQLDQIFGR